jgi:hypothetical protein
MNPGDAEGSASRRSSRRVQKVLRARENISGLVSLFYAREFLGDLLKEFLP